MTWADFAHEHLHLFAVLSSAALLVVAYLTATVRYSIRARYNLQVAATRTTQEEYLWKLLDPVLEENRTLSLGDPIHRHALAKVLAARIVVGDK